MFFDARNLEPDTIVHADVCVVGAGAAGITIARDLVNSGKTVCVVESGGLEFDASTQRLYAGESQGIKVGLNSCRLRFFGGSTNHWSGWCRPLESDDLERRDWFPLSGWPIDYATLRRYYSRAHDTCQIGHVPFDIESLREQLSAPVLPLDARRVRTIVYQYSPPTRFGVVYRDELAVAASVHVYLHANLVGIGFAPRGGAIQSIRCATLEGRSFAVQASRYVLALGGIENARALLAHAQPAGFQNENVGRFFMDHPHYPSGALLVAAKRHDLSLYERRLLYLDVPLGAALGLSLDLRTGERLTTMSCNMRTVDVDEAAELVRELGAQPVASLLRAPDEFRLVTVNIINEQLPVRDNRVTLSRHLDALGIPRVTLRWSVTDEELVNLGRSLRWIGAELGRAGIGRLWFPECDGRYQPRWTIPGCHHMGTTRMSSSPTDGVVDADCRVHGLDNLYVAGSSVFPTAGFANPTLTIVAMAHRLADHLREDS